MTRVPLCLLALALLAGLAPLAGATLPTQERAYTVDESAHPLTVLVLQRDFANVRLRQA